MPEQNIIETAHKIVGLALKKGADAADAVIFDSSNISVRQRLGKPETVEREESTGLGLRVMTSDKAGYKQAIVSTNDVSEKSLAELVERAVSMAKAAPPDPFTGLAHKELLAVKIADLDLYDKNNEPSAEALKDWAIRTEESALAVRGITNSDGVEASYGEDSMALVTSHGFSGAYSTTSFAVSVSVIAGKGTEMETDGDYSSSRHFSDLKNFEEIGKTAATRAVKKLHPRKITTCQAPVIYESRIARSLLGSLAGAINGASISRGTSFLKDMMGKTIFPENVTIIDDPLRLRGLASEPFDAEGVAGHKLAVVENGILKTWLLDVRSAKKLRLTTTGHASRGISSPPGPSASNLYMEPGEKTVSELLSDIKSGFYVTDVFGMGINSVTGDYSQGATGFWIENGEIAYSVSEITIAGNLKDMFINLTPANDLEFLYGINSPTVRVEGMTIAGN